MPNKISIPYIDQPVAFWDKLINEFSSHIKEVYFPLQSDTIGSGRPIQPSKYYQQFLENDSIPKSVLVNPVVLPRPLNELRNEILRSIEHLVNRRKIKGVSVANLALAKIIKQEFPGLEITASSLMDIFSAQQVFILNGIVDVIVPSGRIVRDIKKLNEVRRSFKGRIRLLVNESCLPSCLFRTQHFFEMADRNNSHPESLCDEVLDKTPWLRLTGSWILPQHLYFFYGLYDELKLAGRVSLRNPDDYFEVLESYITLRSLKENKIGGGPASIPQNIYISDDFYKYTLYCDKNCNHCSVCKDYWYANM